MGMRKTWTDAVSEDAHKREESEEKARLWMTAGYVPRRKMATRSPEGTANTRISVP